MEWIWFGFAAFAGLTMLSLISHERQRQADQQTLAKRQADAAAAQNPPPEEPPAAHS